MVTETRETVPLAARACAKERRRRRVCCVSLIFDDDCADVFLAGVCVVLMCAAQLTPARGRPTRQAARTLKKRRKWLVPLNISNFTPRSLTYFDARRMPARGNRPESPTALMVRDLVQFWQRKSFDREKYNFRFNPLRDRHIREYYVGPDTFRNALLVTEKIRALCKPFPTVWCAHFARFWRG